MPRHLIKRFAPTPAKLKKHKYLRHFGSLLRDENVWHLNRRSVSGGVAAGLFWAMIPVPAQMIFSALSAIFFRVNLPISVALVWITNPLTIPPFFYINYRVGVWLLGKPADVGQFQMSLEWIAAELNVIWQPLFLGSLVNGTLLAMLGFVCLRLYWRWYVMKRYRTRNGASKARHRPGG